MTLKYAAEKDADGDRTMADRDCADCGTAPSFLVAVSGGVDSMTLAHLCRDFGHGLGMVVAHCNFHLRGEESDADEAFVREWCSACGIEVRVAEFDTDAYARENGLSIEMAARELRYAWFARLCREEGLDAVLVAHNANDNAETLMLNLLRGTGLAGICGMKPVSAVPGGQELGAGEEPSGDFGREIIRERGASAGNPAAAEGCVPLLRPLLNFTREEIERYARSVGIRWREDSSNSKSDYKRNILRNEVFPLLRKINPSFVKTFNREMRYFRDAATLLEDTLPDLVNNGDCVPADPGGLPENPEDRISIKDLLGYRHWPYILYSILKPYGFNSSTIESIETMIRRTYVEPGGMRGFEGGRVFYSDGYRLYNTARELVLTARTALPPAVLTKVTGPGTYAAGKTSFSVEVVDRAEIKSLNAPDGTLYMDAGKMPFPFAVRDWMWGDWISPFGMGGRRKKISDLFVDLKYDSVLKERALFIERFEEAALRKDTDGAHVYALLGKRIDDAVKVTPATSLILKITIDHQ